MFPWFFNVYIHGKGNERSENGDKGNKRMVFRGEDRVEVTRLLVCR